MEQITCRSGLLSRGYRVLHAPSRSMRRPNKSGTSFASDFDQQSLDINLVPFPEL